MQVAFVNSRSERAWTFLIVNAAMSVVALIAPTTPVAVLVPGFVVSLAAAWKIQVGAPLTKARTTWVPQSDEGRRRARHIFRIAWTAVIMVDIGLLLNLPLWWLLLVGVIGPSLTIALITWAFRVSVFDRTGESDVGQSDNATERPEGA